MNYEIQPFVDDVTFAGKEDEAMRRCCASLDDKYEIKQSKPTLLHMKDNTRSENFLPALPF